MVAGHLLDNRRAVVILKDDEMPDETEKTPFIEHAAQQNLQLRH